MYNQKSWKVKYKLLLFSNIAVLSVKNIAFVIKTSNRTCRQSENKQQMATTITAILNVYVKERERKRQEKKERYRQHVFN